jgi:predicted metal-dependent enzyme (double-stranded beta helix superfamily)
MSALSSISAALGLARLEHFVARFADLLAEPRDEADILARGGRLLGQLVARDDWLPDAYAAPDPARYRQYPLYRDPAGRFSIVSFVWGPGQATPVHDHRVWGLVGVLRGAELVESFVRDAEGALRRTGPANVLDAGEVEAVSPTIGDIHRVANAYDHRVSISIHVYGADIGTVERATYDRSGQPKPFVSGYADVPDLIA